MVKNMLLKHKVTCYVRESLYSGEIYCTGFATEEKARAYASKRLAENDCKSVELIGES